MIENCQVHHKIALHVYRLIGANGSGATVEVDVYVVGAFGRRVMVHTERFVGKLRDSSYVRPVAVWTDTSLGQVSSFELICRPESGAEAQIALVSN